MRVIIAPEFYQQMLQTPLHSEDCYVRPGEYLHHMYIEGVKYIVGPAVLNALAQAEERGDKDAIRHLRLHKLHYDSLMADAARYGSLDGVTLLGDPPPSEDEGSPSSGNPFLPRNPTTWEDLGIESSYLFDSVLRMLFNRGQITGGDLSNELTIPFTVRSPATTGKLRLAKKLT